MKNIGLYVGATFGWLVLVLFFGDEGVTPLGYVLSWAFTMVAVAAGVWIGRVLGRWSKNRGQ
jgi:hypothetical protein